MSSTSIRKSKKGTQRRCIICGKFYIYDRSKGHTLSKCGSCMVNKRRSELKKKCVAYKGGKYEICGYNKCLRALTFHHKDSNKKKFSISGSHCRSWEAVERELKKCVLVCQNCHHELHDEKEGISKRYA